METTTSTGASRPNTDLAAIVDQALALAEKQGARAAVAFLITRGAGSVAGPIIQPTPAPHPRIPT